MPRNHDQITRNEIKQFFGPVKVRALKNAKSIKIYETTKQQPKSTAERRKLGRVGRGKNTPSPASQRIE